MCSLIHICQEEKIANKIANKIASVNQALKAQFSLLNDGF
jgi:hypothetical protein